MRNVWAKEPLDLVREDLRGSGERLGTGDAPYTIKNWRFALCGALFHCFSGMDVHAHISNAQYRAGMGAGFPCVDCPEEQELDAHLHLWDEEDLMYADRVLQRVERMFPHEF